MSLNESGMSEEEVLELKKKEIEEAKHQTEEEKAKLIKEAKKKAKGLLVFPFSFKIRIINQVVIYFYLVRSEYKPYNPPI